MTGRALAALDEAQHGDVAGADRTRDLAVGVARRVCGKDRGTVLVYGGSTPGCGALRTGERLHLLGRDSCFEGGDGLWAVRVVQRDGDAEGAGGVAERGVFTLLVHVALRDLHGGNLRYRAGFVKGDV